MPLAIAIGNCLVRLVADLDGHFFACIGFAPNAIVLTLLEHHMVSKNVRQCHLSVA
jgi:hypothetical protein